MKIYEMAKEFGIKHPEFIDLIKKLGYNYKGFSTEIKKGEVDEMREKVTAFLANDQEHQLRLEHGKAKLIGTAYNPDTKKYALYAFEIPISDLEKLNIESVNEYSTIFNLKPHFANEIYKLGVLKPNPLERRK
jgi:hypothetical protein